MAARTQQPGVFAIIILAVAGLSLFLGKAISVVPFVPLIIVVSIFLFFFSFTYTNAAMVLLIVAMLLSPEFSAGGFSRQRDVVIRIDDLLILVFMFAWLARTALIKGKHFFNRTPINRYILFYCISFTLPTVKSMITGEVSHVQGFFYVFKYLEYIIIFYLVTGVVKDRSQVLGYLKVFMVVFAIVNIYAFTQISSIDRVSAPFEGESEPNTLGGYQVLMLGVLLGLLTHTHFRSWKWPLIALAAFTLIPFAFTLSRSSYMAIVPMYFTLIFFNKMATRTVLIGLLIVATILLIFFFPQNVKERIAYTFQPEEQEGITTVEIMGVKLDPSASARLNDWVIRFDQWKRHPFMGYGVTGAGFLDSQYIRVLVETGLIGLSAFILLLAKLFQHTLKIYRLAKDDLYRGLAIGFLAGHVGMIFHAVSANTFILIRIMEPYWFLAALVMMVPRLDPLYGKAKSALQNNVNNVRNTEFLLNTNGRR